MSNHQDTSKRGLRSQVATGNPLGLLQSAGHEVSVDADAERVVITLTRREGTAHHVLVKPELLPEHAREGAAFKRSPQVVMVAYALATTAELSADIDRHMAQACIGCTTYENVRANYNLETGSYDWFCQTCFYGVYEPAIS
jgi:hypothetical protein